MGPNPQKPATSAKPPGTHPAPPKRRAQKRPQGRPMTRSEAEEVYGIHRWGAGYFVVGPDGHLRVHPTRDPDVWVDLFEEVERLRRNRSAPPIVLRFPQIIETQLRQLHEAFSGAIEEYEYPGRYRGVFPIKVNSVGPFISELVQAAEPWGYGLEAGTKPELALALTSGLRPGSLVIGNGYKDKAYVELACAGVAMGHEVLLVVEKLRELELILDVADRIGVRPGIGLRLKVHARGTGKWEKSGGDASKFGLNTGEILEAVRVLEERGWSDRLQLLHFHIGSQITDVRRIKRGVQEGARFYAALRNNGVEIRYLDVGGGLGVDYDGSGTATDSSVNYSVQEYVNDVVYSVKEVCDEAGVPVPDLINESGRAVAAYHSMAIFSVERRQTIPREIRLPDMPEDADRCVTELAETRAEIGPKNFVECYHDCLELTNQMHSLFNLGRLTLEERAVGEAVSAAILRDVVYYAKVSGRRIPEEIELLEHQIAEKYVVNLSIFQSMPDAWALDQLFPIAPIHRLDETPTVWATLADITCDSDGTIDTFGGVREDRDALRVHRLRNEPYHIGAFLLGAYQDVMGDFHNMLGETKEARIVATGAGQADVTPVRVKAQTSGEVLELFGHKRRLLRQRFMDSLASAQPAGPDGDDATIERRLLRVFDRVLSSTPYLS